jgi:carbon-monoxide dehydrogenase medium subunit
VTHGEIERSALLAERCPLLVEMAREIACGRIRNRGTLGGNLCHADPQEDPPAALLALGARLVIRSAAGRREVHARDFFRDWFVTAVGDGELLEEVRVPEPVAGAGMAYGKFGPRRAMDYASTISAAVVLRRDGQGRIVEAGIGMSGVGPTSVRPARASAPLLGQRATPDVLAAMVAALGEEIEPVGDFEFSADYKRHVAGVLLRRTVQQAYDRAATGKGA